MSFTFCFPLFHQVSYLLLANPLLLSQKNIMSCKNQLNLLIMHTVLNSPNLLFLFFHILEWSVSHKYIWCRLKLDIIFNKMEWSVWIHFSNSNLRLSNFPLHLPLVLNFLSKRFVCSLHVLYLVQRMHWRCHKTVGCL